MRFNSTTLIVAASLLLGTVQATVLPDETEETNVSQYSRNDQGKMLASGENYDASLLSCSHPSLPFGTILRVQSQENGRSVDVKVNDRNKVIKLSSVAATQLEMADAKVPVIAYPIGKTTAKIEPANKPEMETLQGDAIMVSLNSSTTSSFATAGQNTTAPTKREDSHSMSWQERKDPGFAPATAVKSKLPVPVNNRPLRAEFGIYSDIGEAQMMRDRFNLQGFSTEVFASGNQYSVATTETFHSQFEAHEWLRQAQADLGKTLALKQL